jgi:hypothetical protein
MSRLRLAVAVAVMAAGGMARAAVVKPDDAALKAAPVPFPVEEWDALLKKYVDDKGRVDYGRLKGDAADVAKLERLYAAVAASSPKSAPDKYPSKDAQKSYYINAYNVIVWKNVLARFPKMNNVDKEKASFFYFTKFVVGGQEMNLYDLENKVIRPQFKDGRTHMALNCASGGCPLLPRYAFSLSKIEDQLSVEARKFCNEKRNVELDAGTKRLRLSHLFDWYKEDFGKDNDKVIAWINRYRSPEAQIPGDAKIDYVDYDWTLNDVNLLKR